MTKFLIIAGSILIVSCGTSKKEITEGKENVKGKENWVDGIVISNQGTDTIFFHDCYCNIIKSQITLQHVYLGGMHGGQITTNILGDSIDLDLSYWPYDFRTFVFDEKQAVIEKGRKELGSRISGTLIASGRSKSREGETFGFRLKGNFNCVLRDSTYDYMAWYKDLLSRVDSIDMVKLGEIADRKPDSVMELRLNYKNFYLVKDKISSFKNIERLSLSDFPTIEQEIISNFKSLRELRITSDSLRELPVNIGDLQALEIFDVTAPIKDVPEGVYELKNLRELNFGATDIEEISRDIGNLTNLHILNIGYTEITRIPMEIFQLKNLEDLTLPHTLVPFKIKNLELKSIRTLHVSYDFLKYNEADINKLSGLEWLYPSFIYQTHDEYMTKHGNKIKWLEERLPKVRISETTYVND